MGSVLLSCGRIRLRSGRFVWRSRSTFEGNCKIGPERSSLELAKYDAERLGAELLIDCQSALDREKGNFGL
jgi:hypothetical protein